MIKVLSQTQKIVVNPAKDGSVIIENAGPMGPTGATGPSEVASVLTTDGQLVTRASGLLVPITRANLADDTAFTSKFQQIPSAWSTYTPSFTQSVSISKTINNARYFEMGKLVFFQISLVATSAGTANNILRVGLPVTARASGGTGFGTGLVFTGSVNHPGLLYMYSTTEASLLPSSADQANLWGQGSYNLSFAVGYTLNLGGCYEAA